MANESDNYVRCHQAVQLVCAKAVPCIQNALINWHNSLKQKLKPCLSPQTCPPKGKPKTGRGSCSSCVDWGNAVEAAIYPPNSSGSSPWANLNPTLLHKDAIEASKVFVLRLQPGVTFTDVGDFDAASLIMIMMKFVEFHKGDVATCDMIKNVADIRNHLSHVKVNTNLKLDDNETDGYFQDLSDFVTCLSNIHGQQFTTTTAQQVLSTLQEIRNDAFDLDVCQKELIRMYEDEKGKVSLFPFDVDSAVHVDDVFVDLELQSETRAPGFVMLGSKLKSYNDLFDLEKKVGQNSPVMRVLLKGDPGSGKTTLAGKIAYDWAQALKSNTPCPLRKFDLLFVLKMRYFDSDMSVVEAIFDQLLPSDSKVSKRGLAKFLVENAGKVAAIFDGADEYGETIKRSTQGNLIVDIVCNKMLCDSCVVVTTRPHRVNSVKEFSQYSHVKVNGFNEEGILEFIGKFFAVSTFKNTEELYEHTVGKHDNPEYFSEEMMDMTIGTYRPKENVSDNLSTSEMTDDQLKKSVASFIETVFNNYGLMRSMACIPVVLTMLCLLWQECRKLPERFTTLYEEVFHYLTQRWLEKTGYPAESETLEETVRKCLGKVALTCLFEDRLYFSSREFENTDVLDKACSIGILIEEKKRSKLHMIKQYSFIHKTFLEFCAAAYWSSLANGSEDKFSEYLTLINSENIDSQQYVLWFCCGMGSNAARRVLSHLVMIRTPDVITDNRCDLNLYERSSWTIALRLLFESQFPSLVEILTKWLECAEIKITILRTSFGKRRKEGILMYFMTCLEEYIESSGRRGSFAVITTDIMYLRAREDPFYDNFTRKGPQIKSGTRDTGNLINVLLKYTKEKVTVLCSIKAQLDKTVFLTYGLLGRIKTPFHALHIQFSDTVEHCTLNMLSSGEREHFTDIFEQSLMYTGTVIGFFQFDLNLKVTQVSFSPYDISSLLKGILMCMSPDEQKRTTNIRQFVTNCRFKFERMISFLSYSKKLKELRIPIPYYHKPFEVVRGVAPIEIDIFKLLNVICACTCVFKELSTLHVLLSSKSLQGTKRIIETLFRKLQSLSLVGGKEDIILWKSIFRSLACNKTAISLRILNLTFNVLGSATMKIPKAMVHIPQSRKRRYGSKDVQRTLHGLFHWLPSALSLDEYVDEIGTACSDGAIKDLSGVLKNMPNLEDLDLSKTGITPRDIRFIGNGIRHCTALKSLNISGNDIGDGCVSLSEALKCLSNLRTLLLCRTKLGDKGLVALSISLPHLPVLECLSISDNGITFHGLCRLSNVLKNLSNVSALNLSSNPIGDLGILALSAAFQGKSSLTCLLLNDCAMTNAGALLLAMSFKCLPNLCTMDLGRNLNIGPEGVAWVFESLRLLSKLKEVRLDGITFECKKCDSRLRKVFDELNWISRKNRYSRLDSEETVESQKYEIKTLNSSGIRKVLSKF